MAVSLDDIRAAAEILKGRAVGTLPPVSRPLSGLADAP